MKVDNFSAKEIMLRSVLSELRSLPRVGETLEARVLAVASAPTQSGDAQSKALSARLRTSGGLVFTARLDGSVKLTQGETVSMTVAEADDGYILLKLNDTRERPADLQLLLGGGDDAVYEPEARGSGYAAARASQNTPAPDIGVPKPASPPNGAEHPIAETVSETPPSPTPSPLEPAQGGAPTPRDFVQRRDASAEPPPFAPAASQGGAAEIDSPRLPDAAPGFVAPEIAPPTLEPASTEAEAAPPRAEAAERVLPDIKHEAVSSPPEYAAEASEPSEARDGAILSPPPDAKTYPLRSKNAERAPTFATDDTKSETESLSVSEKRAPAPTASEARGTDARRAPEADLAPRQNEQFSERQPQAVFAHARIPVSIHGERRDADIYIKRGKKKRDTAPSSADMLLALDLPALGRWEALMSVSGRDISIRMKVTDDAARALLASNADKLAEILSEAGYRLTQTRVSVLGGDVGASGEPRESRARYIDLIV